MSTIKSNDKIYQIIEHQAKLKCGELWNSMNDKERGVKMLQVAIIMLEDCFGEVENG
ncbi:MAG: hypothetical protein RBR50_01130 [Candidatus Izemoplasmatales bacterium]|nr:hypothetical protein [Candidatus Izemoplasmatales bacterium]